MSELVDFLLEFLAGAAHPSRDRVLLGMCALGSLGCAMLTVWVLFTSQRPLMHTPMGFAACVGSIVIGGGGMFAALLIFSRSESDRPFALACVVANLPAVALASFGLITW